MKNRLVGAATKFAAVLAVPALGLALTAVPAQAASDTNLSGFDQAGLGSATSSVSNGGQQSGFGTKTIGDQKVSSATAPKDAMPDNPSQKLPDKVSSAIPDDATVVSKDVAVTKDGQVKNVETGKPVTDPKVVGTQDTPPDPLAKTNGKKFIPVEASEVKKAVEKNGGDAVAKGGNDSGSSSSNVDAASDIGTAKKTSGRVQNVGSWASQYGAHWGSYNGTEAFFDGGNNLFVQQARGVVDVSEHQGTIDWQAAKNDGVEGAIIRIGFGWNNRNDYQAIRNINECKRLGIPFGIYLYSYAYDNNGAWAEGQDTVKKLHDAGVYPGDLSYPVYYDLENWTWTGHTPPTDPWVYDGIVNTWYGCLQNSGYNNLSVYSYTYYLNTSLNTNNIRSHTRWVASYGSRTGFNYSSNDRGWQYADNGSINGIGNVDLNAFGNYYYAAGAMSPAEILSPSRRVDDIAEGDYFIGSDFTDRYVDVGQYSYADCAKIGIWTPTNGLNQLYHIKPLGDGTYSIVAKHSNKAIDVYSGFSNNGADIIQYTSNGGVNQHWRFYRAGDGTLYIASGMPWASDKVLDIYAGSSDPGTKLELWQANSGWNQRFRLMKANMPSGPQTLKSRSSSNRLDIWSGSTADGAKAEIWTPNSGGNQMFYFADLGNGRYGIRALHSGKYLDIAYGWTGDGGSVIQYPWHQAYNQEWYFEGDSAGSYAIKSVMNNKAIDIKGGSTSPGSEVITYQYMGQGNQKWWIGR
ncbi:RICIN domain-containing protein [Bifidobacterium sp. ESL0784]|uniref:RICIN domain-containing protein n=1 Tax=Bifidobacterium sp. ESL0784 TaxID=2983231 RepID=UPI0023F813ED|nr:RICIN domain-containing protein [Bifidobacterium sp. ESL0784]MDF7640757.1 RICIN domain-containing protein [Bifidobacterium sp. ESL0784]